MNIDDLPYRQAVAAVVLDNKNRILLMKSIHYKEGWRLPGGGVESDDKTSEAAIFRELYEEFGTDKFQLIKAAKIRHQYEWPEDTITRYRDKKGQQYRGQIQKIFLVNFLGNEDDIKINTSELKEYKWVPIDEMDEYLVFEGQLEKYKEIFKEFDL